jgi:hypothetical protein
VYWPERIAVKEGTPPHTRPAPGSFDPEKNPNCSLQRRSNASCSAFEQRIRISTSLQRWRTSGLVLKGRSFSCATMRDPISRGVKPHEEVPERKGFFSAQTVVSWRNSLLKESFCRYGHPWRLCAAADRILPRGTAKSRARSRTVTNHMFESEACRTR